MTTQRILSTLSDGMVIMASGAMIPMAARVVERLRAMALSVEFQQLEVEEFAYPESWVELVDNVRGKSVFLFHGFTEDPDKDFMRMQIICDAVNRGRARSITLITPFMPYTRQDRVQAREPFSAKLIAKMIEVNPIIEQMVTVDLHAPQIAGFFDRIYVENIPGHAMFAPYIRQHFGDIRDKVTIVSTDVGGSKRARDLANVTWEDLGVAIVDKRRDRSGSQALSLVGEVKETVFLFDDIGDTAGSLVNAANMVRNQGAKDVYAIVSHAILSPKGGTSAEKKLLDAGLKLIAADTFPRDESYLAANTHITMIRSDAFMTDLIIALITVNGSIRNTIKTWARKPTFD